MKRLLKFVGFSVLFLLAVLIAAEGILRFCYSVAASPESIARIKFYNDLQIRLYTLWMSPKQTDPFLPPFLVYSNRGFQDPHRLTEIFETTKLPASQTWESYDFLQHESRNQETRYRVSSNSLGFRGREYPKVKPPNTTRIIALGSYQTFGLGLNDEETFPAQLEAELNRTAKTGHKYEVWNGGRPAGTAIVALARMKHEILEYRPDVIIFDYGFIDLDVWGDNVFPIVLRLPEGRLLDFIKGSILQPLIPIFGNTFLWTKIHSRFFIGKVNIDPNSKDGYRLGQFRETLEALVSEAAKNNIRVVLMRNLLSRPPTNVYSEIADKTPNARLLVVSNLFLRNPPTPEQWLAANWKSTWLGEFESPAIWSYDHDFRYYPYRLDFFQLNREGQAVVARGLAEILQPERLTRQPKK